jgi:DNA polymerase phi
MMRAVEALRRVLGNPNYTSSGASSFRITSRMSPFQAKHRSRTSSELSLTVSFHPFKLTLDSLFSNTSSSERKYWGFTFISQVLPLLPSKSTPQIFTPNFMRCWTNSLSSPDRYLHKAALGVAKLVQDVVKANPSTGFALLSTLVGRNGKMDFDRATKTKTVEGIISGLSEEGVEEYVQYLQGIVNVGEG